MSAEPSHEIRCLHSRYVKCFITHMTGHWLPQFTISCLSLYTSVYNAADLPKAMGKEMNMEFPGGTCRCHDFRMEFIPMPMPCMERSSDKTCSKTIPLTFWLRHTVFSECYYWSVELQLIRLWNHHKLLLNEDITPTNWLMNKSGSKYQTVYLPAPHFNK